jgi:hypothetical protein
MDMQKYAREQEKANVSNYVDSMERTKPVLYKDVKKMNPVSILEKYLLLWPPCDVRCEQSYQATHDFNFTDSQFMDDIADGMELKVIGRDPINNAIVLGIYLQSNLAEFERYNQVVEEHNDEWTEQGCPVDTFNPITGDINEIKEQLISYADTDSRYIKRPGKIQSDGPLTKARPNAKRSLYAQLEVRLRCIQRGSTDKSTIFETTFVAKDYDGRIVYYNGFESKDIAYSTRRVIQEVFGNPFVYGKSGALLDGIAYLIQGKKLQICVKESVKPLWMTGTLKNSNPKLSASHQVTLLYKVLGSVFGIVLPPVLFWNGVVMASYNALKAFNETLHGNTNWFPTVIGTCVLIVLSFLIAKYFFRMSNVTKLNSNLL